MIRPTRRSFLAAAVTVVGMTVAACGSGGDDSGSTTGTHVVEHAMGRTTVSDSPQRIVVIDSPQLDALVALGITPVGATESGAAAGFPGYLADRLDGTESVGLTQDPSIEKIAALRPDLIIGSKVRHEKIYDELSGIAPTVFSVDSGTNWREQANITAAAVNRTDRMNTLLGDLDARAARVGEQVHATGTTASIVRFRASNFRIYGPATFSGTVLTSMGFTLPEQQWNEYSMVELSPERFPQITGDRIFYTEGSKAGPTAQTITSRWGALPAVAAGHAHPVEDETWMVGIGVVGAGRIIDDVQRLMGPN